MRAVLDTNVVLSALLWGGNPERLIEAAGDGRLELFTLETLLAELAGILQRPKFSTKLQDQNVSGAELLARYAQLVQTIEPARIAPVITRDPVAPAPAAATSVSSGYPGRVTSEGEWLDRSRSYILRMYIRPRRLVMQIARIFTNGNSQAVRLPKDFRFKGGEVVIKKVGDMVILFPKKYSAARLKALLSSFDEDFAIERDQPAVAEERNFS